MNLNLRKEVDISADDLEEEEEEIVAMLVPKSSPRPKSKTKTRRSNRSSTKSKQRSSRFRSSRSSRESRKTAKREPVRSNSYERKSSAFILQSSTNQNDLRHLFLRQELVIMSLSALKVVAEVRLIMGG